MNRKSNKEWLYAGYACFLGGALIAVLTGRQRWFALGGLSGAALVGYKIYKNNQVAPIPDDAQQQYLKQVMKDKPDFDRLGAPDIPAVETPNVGTPEMQTRSGVEGYPVPFRVPDTEVHIDTMDDRIRPHFVGPLGPANDPVRYW